MDSKNLHGALLIWILISLLVVNGTESCKILRYKHSSDESDDFIYYKDEKNQKCNSQPIYKMKDQPSFIFKTADDYWCEQYIPSKLIDCRSDCTEIRFKMSNWKVVKYVVPEELELRETTFSWIPKTTHKIVCDDEKNDLLTTTKKIVTASRTHEQLLDNKFDEIKSIQKNPLILTKELTDEDIDILETLLKHPQSEKVTSLSGKNIFKNNIKTCPKIELHVKNEMGQIDLSLNFEIFYGVECRNFPVYKSQENFYLFRNTFGYWCQDLLDNFQTSINCNQNCNQMKLGPIGIKSPIEANHIEVLNERTQEVEFSTQNFQFMCANFVNCMTIGCLNGGTCQYFNDKNAHRYECVCPPQYSDPLCSTLDPCFDNMCQNGGSCIVTHLKQASCACTSDFYGNMCEFKNTTCKYNPCLNGGTCLKQLSETKFECSCNKKYTGDLCQQLILPNSICDKKEFGEFVQHPVEKNKFVICLNGANNVQECPKGLIFNPYVNRCDYNDNRQENEHTCDQNPCLNGGTCEKLDNNYTCHCTQGFEGLNCEINSDDCEDNKCGPNGKCVDLIHGYVCVCEHNFYGVDCETNKVKIPCNGLSTNNYSFGKTQHFFPFDPSIIVECNEKGNLLLNKCPSSLYWNPFSSSCSYEPINFKMPIECLNKQCKNDAKCELNVNKTAVCICKSGFEGEFCEINTDDCLSNPCLNDGVCVDGVNGHQCKCKHNFLDTDCSSTGDFNPCLNVMNHFNSKKDKTVRHGHPFTREKFLVCSLEGWAQVLSCPKGLVWSEEEEACAHKDDDIYFILERFCSNDHLETKLNYPYSFLKYVQCKSNEERNDDVSYKIIDCPKTSPFYCEQSKACVKNLDTECSH